MSNKVFLMSIGIAAFLGAGTFFVTHYFTGTTENPSSATSTIQSKKIGIDPGNISYVIDGKQQIDLTNGRAEGSISSDSASKIITTIFGDPVFGDINGDGVKDAAIILMQETGGSGTFFYAAAATRVGNDYEGTNAVFLGDRIAPQTIEIRDGLVIVNYAERKNGEPMTAVPSVGISKYLIMKDRVLVEKVQTTGTLSGEVFIGPICPVERADVPCKTPPEAYTSREVIVYAKDGKTEVARKHFDVTGYYEFSLKPGNYVMNIPRQGIGGSKDLPKKIVVVAGRTTMFNFSIDTGIR